MFMSLYLRNLGLYWSNLMSSSSSTDKFSGASRMTGKQQVKQKYQQQVKQKYDKAEDDIDKNLKADMAKIQLKRIIIYAIIILFILFLLTLRNKFHIQDLFEKNKEKILNLEETQPEPEIVIAPTPSEDDSYIKIVFLVFFTGGIIFFYYTS